MALVVVVDALGAANRLAHLVRQSALVRGLPDDSGGAAYVGPGGPH